MAASVVLPATLIATTQGPKLFLISAGDEIERNLNFGVRLAHLTSPGSVDMEFATILLDLGFDGTHSRR